MGINLKKIFSMMILAQMLYTTVVLAAHIMFAKSISGFWHGEMLAHFLHYEMALLPFAITLIIYRKFPKLAIGFLAVCAVGAVSLYKSSRPQVTYERAISLTNYDRILQVICYNGNTHNATKKKFADWLQARYKFNIPTLFVLLEASPEWEQELVGLEKLLPHTVKKLSEDNFGILLASNLDLSKVHLEEYTYGDIPAIVGEIKFSSKKFAFGAVHPFPPISGHWYNERNDYLKNVKEWLVSTKLPVISCGDFNTTAWTKSYDRFVGEPVPLKDTFWGPLRPSTWGVIGLYTTIDFIFYSHDFELITAEVGPKNGSDHTPVAALLRWK